MLRHAHKRTRGFTMVELLVVLAVVAILASLAIPTLARLGPGARDEISNTSQTVFSLLKAARIYAATYRVETAVVYVLDNYQDPPVDVNASVGEAVFDTVLNQPVRVIRGAAVMARNPCGHLEPIPRSEGSFIEFDPNACILLQAPDNSALYYQNMSVRIQDAQTLAQLQLMSDNLRSANGEGNPSEPPFPLLGPLGMRLEPVVVQGDPCAVVNNPSLAANPAYAFTVTALPTHVFDQKGVLMNTGQKERETIYVGYMPNVAAEERVINTSSLTGPVQAVPIYLYRSTGRVKIGDRNEGII